MQTTVVTSLKMIHQAVQLICPGHGQGFRRIWATARQPWTPLKIWGSLVALCLLATACKDSKVDVVMSTTDESSPPTASRPGAKQGAEQAEWRLVHWSENKQTIALVPQAPITLALEQGSISGSGGCNQFEASYRKVGGRIIIDPIIATRRACEQPRMDQENRFFGALQQVHKAIMAPDDQLTLSYGGTSAGGTLVFTNR